MPLWGSLHKNPQHTGSESFWAGEHINILGGGGRQCTPNPWGQKLLHSGSSQTLPYEFLDLGCHLYPSPYPSINWQKLFPQVLWVILTSDQIQGWEEVKGTSRTEVGGNLRNCWCLKRGAGRPARLHPLRECQNWVKLQGTQLVSPRNAWWGQTP